MKKLVAALFLLPLLPLTQSVYAAPSPPGAGTGAAGGKTYWESNLTACKNCHGGVAEGAFGPDLAGRGLNGAQVYRAAQPQRGKVTVNRLPPPGRAAYSTRPRCAFAICRTMASPSPEPLPRAAASDR